MSTIDNLFEELALSLSHPGRLVLRRFLSGNTDEDTLRAWLRQLVEEDVDVDPDSSGS